VGEDRSATRRRVTVPEAAQLLGITVEDVRGRIKRNTLRYEKAPDGTVYVLLNADQPRPVADQSTNQSADQALLIARLENEVQFLRGELTRKDAIMMNMTESMRQLTAPAEETRESPTEATPQPGRVEPQMPLEGAQEPRESAEMHMPEAGGGPLPRDQQTPSERPWWRRVFGG
jgi:hypothetical protein